MEEQVQAIEHYCQLISMRLKELREHDLPDEEAHTLFNDVETYARQMIKVAKNAQKSLGVGR